MNIFIFINLKDYDYNDFCNSLPGSNLPINIQNFIGRRSYLERIKEAFTSNNKKIVVLTSITGMGKSSIATQYGYDFKTNGFVYWIDCKNVESEFAYFFSDSNEKIKIDLIKAKLDNLKEKFNFLFIFDNCDEYHDIEYYVTQLSHLPNVVLLITTKNSDLKTKTESNITEFVELKLFEENESIEFIEKNLKDSIDDQSEINNLIDFLQLKNRKVRPSDLFKLITFIKLEFKQSNSLKSIINDLKKAGYTKLEEMVIDDKYFASIKAENEQAWVVLKYTSFLDPDFIPIDIYTDLIGIDQADLVESLNLFNKLSLMRLERKSDDLGFRLHEILRNETNEYIKIKNEIEFNEIISEYYIKLANIIEDNKWKKQKYFSNFRFITDNSIGNSKIKNENKSSLSLCFGNFIIHELEIFFLMKVLSI